MDARLLLPTSLAALLCPLWLGPAAALPLAACGSDPLPKQLERSTRETLATEAERRAGDLVARVRGGTATATAEAPVPSGPQAAEADQPPADEDADAPAEDPLLARLAAIEERLAAIEALLVRIDARASAAAEAGAAAAPPSAAVGAPAALEGAPVAGGYQAACFQTYHVGIDATVKLSVNGLPVGRFDSDGKVDLAPYLQPGRANQIALAVEPHGKTDPKGLQVFLTARLPGAEDDARIYEFRPTRDRLVDVFELPWAAR